MDTPAIGREDPGEPSLNAVGKDTSSENVPGERTPKALSNLHGRPLEV
jgi:hypothetical protein